MTKTDLGKSGVAAKVRAGGRHDVGNSRNPGRGVARWSSGDHRRFRVLRVLPAPVEGGDEGAAVGLPAATGRGERRPERTKPHYAGTDSRWDLLRREPRVTGF